MSSPQEQARIDKAARLLHSGFVVAREQELQLLGEAIRRGDDEQRITNCIGNISHLDQYTEQKFGLQALKAEKSDLINRIVNILFPPKEDTNG